MKETTLQSPILGARQPLTLSARGGEQQHLVSVTMKTGFVNGLASERSSVLDLGTLVCFEKGKPAYLCPPPSTVKAASVKEAAPAWKQSPPRDPFDVLVPAVLLIAVGLLAAGALGRLIRKPPGLKNITPPDLPSQYCSAQEDSASDSTVERVLPAKQVPGAVTGCGCHICQPKDTSA